MSVNRSSYGHVQFGISMTTRGKTTGKSERLSVLNNAEQEALYGLPDFDDAQQLEFLTMDEFDKTLAFLEAIVNADDETTIGVIRPFADDLDAVRFNRNKINRQLRVMLPTY